MDLPFSPNFFKKIDIFQQLKEYDQELSEKRTWVVEKLILEWAAGPGHQHIGEHVSPDIIKQALIPSVNANRIPTESITYVATIEGVSQALKSLVVRGYADPLDQQIYPNHVRFNNSGLVAGKIILETSNLTKIGKYILWARLWWVVAIAGIVVLLVEAFFQLGSLFTWVRGIIK